MRSDLIFEVNLLKPMLLTSKLYSFLINQKPALNLLKFSSKFKSSGLSIKNNCWMNKKNLVCRV